MRKRKHERGQSLLEFALLLPILLLILAGVLDLGRLYYAYVAVTDAAAEGAAYAAIHPNATYEEIEARATEASGGLIDLETYGTVEVIRPVIAPGQPVTVAVTFDFTLGTPIIQAFFEDGQIPLRAVAAEVIRTTP
jgi:hypothetical protein